MSNRVILNPAWAAAPGNPSLIRSERLKRRLSQEDLAKMVNISESHISSIERGSKPIVADVRARLEAALGKKLDPINDVAPTWWAAQRHQPKPLAAELVAVNGHPAPPPSSDDVRALLELWQDLGAEDRALFAKAVLPPPPAKPVYRELMGRLCWRVSP